MNDMEQSKIDRINQLARKAKTEGLSDMEKKEQHALRQEYLSAFRQSLASTLEQVVIVDPDGNRSPVKKKEPPKQ